MEERQRTQVWIWALVPVVGLAFLVLALTGRGFLWLFLPFIFLALMGVIYFIFQGRTRRPGDRDTH
jgi:hypothetical protein